LLFPSREANRTLQTAAARACSHRKVSSSARGQRRRSSLDIEAPDVESLTLAMHAGVSALTNYTNASRRTHCSKASAVTRGSICAGTTASATVVPPPVLELSHEHGQGEHDCNDQGRLSHVRGADLGGTQACAADSGGYSRRQGTAYSEKLEMVRRWTQEALQLTPLPSAPISARCATRVSSHSL
jgi:hypothetical protein